MGSLADWWDALEGAMKLFYGIAFASTAVLVVQTLLTFTGVDADGADGLDGDTPGTGDVSVLSLRTVVAFLVGLGWMGAILRDIGWSLALAIPVALVVGLGMMLFVFWLMKLLYSLRASGNIDIARAIGETGTVYLPIPPRREKAGKIEVLLQDRLAIVDAFTESEERLENRSKVLVVDMVGDSALLVAPVRPA